MNIIRRKLLVGAKVSFLGTDGELAYDNESGEWVVTESGNAFGWDIEYSS